MSLQLATGNCFHTQHWKGITHLSNTQSHKWKILTIQAKGAYQASYNSTIWNLHSSETAAHRKYQPLSFFKRWISIILGPMKRSIFYRPWKRSNIWPSALDLENLSLNSINGHHWQNYGEKSKDSKVFQNKWVNDGSGLNYNTCSNRIGVTQYCPIWPSCWVLPGIVHWGPV